MLILVAWLTSWLDDPNYVWSFGENEYVAGVLDYLLNVRTLILHMFWSSWIYFYSKFVVQFFMFVHYLHMIMLSLYPSEYILLAFINQVNGLLAAV